MILHTCTGLEETMARNAINEMTTASIGSWSALEGWNVRGTFPKVLQIRVMLLGNGGKMAVLFLSWSR
jgi:hypothetical protein